MVSKVRNNKNMKAVLGMFIVYGLNEVICETNNYVIPVICNATYEYQA